MNRTFPILVLALVAVASPACGPVTRMSVLRSKAAFALECPEDELTITSIGGRSNAGVEGCGQRATYIYTTTNQDWFLQSRGESRGATSGGSETYVAPHIDDAED